MSPSSDRWRPRRAGIINLYEYANQVFNFAGGRLLLRGHNTSGKTKALELLLPFCLDGDISPNKLDPFGGAYKDMKWNLVGCTEDEKRTGYVWIEFERLDSEGELERLTAGIGMRANKSLADVARWFFVARNRLVGSDLHLLRGREPISRAELVAALGEDGEVLDTQRDYRGRLNDLLFGFTGEEQYQTMLRLMRDLRRPHLSKTLDPERVAQQLTVGLPTVDESLMRRLAGGLEQIETLERGLTRLREVRDRVRRFHQRTYSAYARAVVRERADALRQAQTGVENAAERLRDTRADLERESERAERASAERTAAETTLNELSAERDALVSSEVWSSVAEVEAIGAHASTKRKAAAAARERADQAVASATAAEAELITAQAAGAEQRALAESDLLAAVGIGDRAGLGARIDHLAGQLRDGSIRGEVWGTLVRDLVADWRDVLHRHRELTHAAASARRAAERAREEERAAAAGLEGAAGRVAAAEADVESARVAATEALTTWHEALTELELTDEDTMHALELVSSGRSPEPALSGTIERHRRVLGEQQAGLRATRSTLEETIADTETEIEQLRAAHDDGPPPPAWSRAPRAERPGAPLWRLIDFKDHVTASERSACEAALEAAGLLDAWVTPDGRLDDASLADVVAEAGELVPTASLLHVLTAVPGQPVDTPVVERLLRSLALGEQPGRAWFDLHGRFSIGPLVGRGAKQAAEHIGAAARDARRARRIAELRRQRDETAAQVADLDARLAAHSQRRETLEAEVASVPRPEEVAAALQALGVATELEANAARAHDAVCAATRAAADAEIAADAARRDHAAAHRLPAALDESSLDRLREATAALPGAATAAARSWMQAEREERSAANMAARVTELREAAAEHDRGARDEEAEAQRLGAEHAAREAALGATGAQVRRRYAEVLTGLEDARVAQRRAAETEKHAEIAVHDLKRDAEARAADHDAARTRRESVSTGVRQLGQSGILQLVLGEDAPADAEHAAGWTFTRALEIARALPADILAAQTNSGERGLEVQRQVQLLDRELAEADMGAYAIRGEDDLLVVRVAEGGVDQPLPALLESLSEEIDANEQVLSAEERRVFNDALVEEIADHLRQRIHAVRGTVQRMNAVLQHSPTAAGKIVELDWQALDDGSGTHRAALALVRREVRHLDQEGREELVAFFRSRIEAARREHGWTEQPRPMAETLMRAFDYRSWFAFGLWERSSAGRVGLTKKRHAVGSGGEQSVLIHLPLFAAAAALYGDAKAPRLVMLDEALSGIDDETRERVLKATVDFDLDLVMTSHELWGTYASVPQLAIYQLHRENGSFGVHALPFLWDGDVLHELEQGELLV